MTSSKIFSWFGNFFSLCLRTDVLPRFFPSTDGFPRFTSTDVLSKTFWHLFKKYAKNNISQQHNMSEFMEKFYIFCQICSIFRIFKLIFIPVRELFGFFSKYEHIYFSCLIISEILKNFLGLFCLLLLFILLLLILCY